jgi:hypothetical protein
MNKDTAYTVHWEELVYDADDALESVNPMDDLAVEATSVHKAKSIAEERATAVIAAKRTGQWSSGSYQAHIYAITDTRGTIHRVGEPCVVAGGGLFAPAQS